MDYTHDRFGPERCRSETTHLDPPLHLLAGWPVAGVGYLPKIADGRMFASFLDGRVAAFQEGSAEPLWSFRLPESYEAALPNDGDLLVSGPVLLTRLGDELFLLDAATGRLLDRQAVPQFNLRSALFDGSRLVGAYVDESHERDEYFYACYDLWQRAILWQHRSEQLPTSLAGSRQRVFVSASLGQLSGLDTQAGTIFWTSSVQKIGAHRDLAKRASDGAISGVPVVQRDLVIAAVRGYHIVAFDQATGAVRWDTAVEMINPYTLACAADGTLAVIDDANYCQLDAATGRVLSRLNVADSFPAGEATQLTEIDVTTGYLYFCDVHRGVLRAMDRQTGQMPWSYRCANAVPVFNAPVVINGRLYLLDEGHHLYVFAGA